MSCCTYPGEELELFAEAQNWKSYVAEQLRGYLRGDVLEVGAGIGATTESLCNGEQRSWLCLEPDAELAAEISAADLASRTGIPIETAIGTLDDLPAERQFDTIIYIDVLEHIADDRGEMQRAAGRLRTGGRLVVLSPAHQFLFSPFDASIGHYRRYTKRTLYAICPPELMTRRLFYLDSVGLLASLANRLVLRQSLPSRQQIRFWDRSLVQLSRLADIMSCHTIGKTIIGVFESPASTVD